MARRSRALVLLCVTACGGAAATTAAPTTTGPAAAPSASNAPSASVVATAKPPPFVSATIATGAATALHAPTFTLPRPLPPVNAMLNLGIDPPTPAKLETVFAATKPGTSEHAGAGRRLAELCRRYELTSAEVAAAAADKKKFLAARKEYELMRHCVLDAYRKIADGDPSYAHGDEVLDALAAEYDDRRVFVADEDGPLVVEDRQKALAASLELVKRYPLSRHVARAYRRFADHYFDEAMRGKIDWKIPEEAYARVRDASDARTQSENAYALYRSGYVAWNQADAKGAKTAFHGAIDVTTKNPTLPFAKEIAAAANDALANVP